MDSFKYFFQEPTERKSQGRITVDFLKIIGQIQDLQRGFQTTNLFEDCF